MSELEALRVEVDHTRRETSVALDKCAVYIERIEALEARDWDIVTALESVECAARSVLHSTNRETLDALRGRLADLDAVRAGK
jgi:uncharacterized protein (UPF0335 family)